MEHRRIVNISLGEHRTEFLSDSSPRFLRFSRYSAFATFGELTVLNRVSQIEY